MENEINVSQILLKLLSDIGAVIDEAKVELARLGKESAGLSNPLDGFVKTGVREKTPFINSAHAEEKDPIAEIGAKIPSSGADVLEEAKNHTLPPEEEPRGEIDPLAEFEKTETPAAMTTPMPQEKVVEEPAAFTPPSFTPEEPHQEPPARMETPMPSPQAQMQAPAEETPAPLAGSNPEVPQMTRQEFETLYTDAWGKIWAESGGNLEKAKQTLAEWIAPYKAEHPYLFDDQPKAAAEEAKETKVA